MLMVQLVPAARLVPQLLVCVKLEAFPPVTAKLVMLSAALPGFERVTVCAALVVPVSCGANVNDVAPSTACGAMPAPVMATVFTPTLLSIDSVAASASGEDGVTVTEMVQFAP